MSYRNPGTAFSPAKTILIIHYEEKTDCVCKRNDVCGSTEASVIVVFKKIPDDLKVYSVK